MPAGSTAKAPLLDAAGKSTKQVALDGDVFGAEVKPHLVHETVRAELNALRAGTRGAKSRGLVSGGRAKPWRQKGTGRARAGTTRAPHLTGGGVAFPPVDAHVRRQGQPQGSAGCAARRALRARPSRARSPLVDGAAFDGAVDEERPRSSRPGARSPAGGRLRRRRGEPAQVVPQPAEGRGRRAGRARGRRGRLGALAARHRRPRSSSAGARRQGAAARRRRRCRVSLHPNAGAARPGRLGEELRR